MSMAETNAYAQYMNAVRSALARLDNEEKPDSAYDDIWAKLKAAKRG